MHSFIFGNNVDSKWFHCPFGSHSWVWVNFWSGKLLEIIHWNDSGVKWHNLAPSMDFMCGLFTVMVGNSVANLGLVFNSIKRTFYHLIAVYVWLGVVYYIHYATNKPHPWTWSKAQAKPNSFFLSIRVQLCRKSYFLWIDRIKLKSWYFHISIVIYCILILVTKRHEEYKLHNQFCYAKNQSDEIFSRPVAIDTHNSEFESINYICV